MLVVTTMMAFLLALNVASTATPRYGIATELSPDFSLACNKDPDVGAPGETLRCLSQSREQESLRVREMRFAHTFVENHPF
ncbi:hypothetical protein Syun_006357 [Stephania yunnanensis]|uniref:Uncharacterized protein n=1 Tax=Stephania yunnanensis TaxID=152371 RepID=A0AAP0Q1A2_9MAGN